MKKYILLFALFTALFTACSDDDNDIPTVNAPTTYEFTRDGSTSVSFSGQTTRILMSEEIIDAFKDFDNATEQSLLDMFANENSPFADSDLNASDKSVKSKTAASRDYFSANTATQAAIQADFESWVTDQIDLVFPAENVTATAGNPGQLADGTSTRYVNAQGLELNQAFNKSLIGALMVDQALNNYLSPSVLDDGDSRANNDGDVLETDKNYTFMEHKWDEAYGYLYGTAEDTTDPNPTIGADDSFLNKYIGRVEGDDDFAGIAATIYDAFKLGRAAIVAKQYDVRDQQAEIIREEVSKVIGVRAVYYLQQGKSASEDGGKFHDLSEGYGFIYSLQFTRRPGTNSPYFTKTEVDNMIAQLMGDGENGFWDVSDETLDSLSSTIANAFGFTVEQAGS